MSANDSKAVRRITRLCQIYGLNYEKYRGRSEEWFVREVVTPILLSGPRCRVERLEPSIWAGLPSLPDQSLPVRMIGKNDFRGWSRNKLPMEPEPDEYWFRRGSDLASRGIDSPPSQRWK